MIATHTFINCNIVSKDAIFFYVYTKYISGGEYVEKICLYHMRLYL